MTVGVQTTNTTNTFDFWRTQTNLLANAMSTVVITTNSNTASGNAAITGLFNANSFQTTGTSNTQINSGSITLANSTSNLTLSIPTPTQIANNYSFLNANGQYAYVPPTKVTTGILAVSGLASVNVAYTSLSLTPAIEYLVHVTDNVSNNFQTAKILCTHNYGSSFSTEYAQIFTNNVIGLFATTTNSTAMILTYTSSASTNTTVRFTGLSVFANN